MNLLRQTATLLIAFMFVSGCEKQSPKPEQIAESSANLAPVSQPLPAAAVAVNGVFPPPRQARVAEIAAMFGESPDRGVRPIQDREFWEAVRTLPKSEEVMRRAEAAAKEPTPELNEADYLTFSQSGDRQPYQGRYASRSQRLSNFTLAEAMENQGRFLPLIEKELSAILSETTWALPAHDKDLRSLRGIEINVDLGAAMRAWTVGMAEAILQDRLLSETRSKIRSEIKKRVLDVYLAQVAEGKPAHLFWLDRTNNWNAVCHAGVVGAALLISDSPEEKARVIAAAELYLPKYLEGYGEDGYLDEGVGYLNYGLGHYVLLADVVRRATDGQLDWFQGDNLGKILDYAAGLEIAGGVFPSFSDGRIGDRPVPWLGEFLATRRGEASGLTTMSWVLDHPLGGMLYRPVLLARLRLEMPTSQGPMSKGLELGLRTKFASGGVLVLRPSEDTPEVGLAAALKGGHNGENHNQNDLGTYVVVIDGKTVLPDLGMAVYDNKNFTDQRYENPVNSSLGHSVPVVAGQAQKTGKDARAVTKELFLNDEMDTWLIDLTTAYAVPALADLSRKFIYRREETASLEILDTVHFHSPEKFESVIIAPAEWKRLDGPEMGWIITWSGRSVKAVVSSAPEAGLVLREEPLGGRLVAKLQPTRLIYGLSHPMKTAKLRLTLTPHSPDSNER
jgi:hypothetical protein